MLARQINAQQKSVSTSLAAPVRGLNDKDAIQDMKPEFALMLDNWVARSDYVELRAGSSSHATGVGAGAVETLMAYRSGTSSKLLAAGGGSIYDATATGAVGSALGSGYSNDRWQYVNVNGYILAVNGADTPIEYDGSAIANSIMTGSGLTTSNLIHVNVFKERVWFVEKDTLNAWYLPVKAITGTATVFDLSFVARRGGSLAAMMTLSRDGGDGLDDIAVFLTTEGEALVYQGTDPSSASTWALVGIYYIGKPVGRRCFENYGAESIFIGEDGIFPVSAALREARTNDRLALSDNIRNTFRREVDSHGDVFGWQPILYVAENLLLVNVVRTDGVSVQYVMDTAAGGWSRFTDWQAKCFVDLDDVLYFGGSGGIVYKAYDGLSDSGSTITADCKTAYHYFGRDRARRKTFHMIRPILQSSGIPDAYVRLDFDFKSAAITTTPGTGTSTGTPWGSAWGSPWSSSENTTDDWLGIEGDGYAASTVMRVATNNMTVRWIGTDYVYERGNIA